jgi:hypothetical protein
MIRVDDYAEINLDDLAAEHYRRLVGELLVDGTNYHATSSLVQRIRIRREADIGDAARTRVWNYLLDNDFQNLRRVVTGRPNELRGIITEIEALNGPQFFATEVNYNNSQLTAFGQIIKTTFNYKRYRNKPDCSYFVGQFNSGHCPYCNENVLHVIELVDEDAEEGEVHRLALLQLDHFYPQSRHPYFGVSFFNLIPGCSVCNAQLKLDKRFDIETHFNPFEKRFDDFFRFKLSTFVLTAEHAVDVQIEKKTEHELNAIDDFQILVRYNELVHRHTIFKLVNTFKNHTRKINSSIARQIVGLFRVNETPLDVLVEAVNVPRERREIHLVQLGKLKRDVLIQMGVLPED